MSEPMPRPSGKAATFLMAMIGVILLLPGVCAIVFVAMFLGDGGFSFKDQISQMVLVLWGLCFAASLCGLLMLRAARRRGVQADGR